MQDSGAFHLIPWILICLFLLAGALCYVRFTSGTEKHKANVTALRRDLDVRAKELENLKIQQETLTSGRYIRAAVKRMELKLRVATKDSFVAQQKILNYQ